MKKLIVLLIAVLAVPHFAQINAGVNAGFVLPIGSLNYRYKPALSYGFSLGNKSKEEGLYWNYFVEYVKFGEENRSNLNVLRKVTQNNKEAVYSIPLPKLKMSLEVISASAQMNYPVYKAGDFHSTIHAGFGVYRWFNKRSEVIDSLFAQTPTGSVFVEYLKVAESNQLDWSGGVNLGVEGKYSITPSFSVSLSADYRLVVGELWAALKLDLENVSGMQMAQFRAGINYQF